MTHSRFDAQVIEAAPRNFVVSTQLGEGLALLDLRSNVYFSLSEVGTIVWETLQAPTTKAEIVERVVAVYDVTTEQCEDDIDALLGELVDARLADVHPPAVT